MRGFTLVELIIYIAVLSVILVLIVMFTLNVIEASAKSAAKEEVQTNTATVLQAFDFIIRDAQSVYDPTSNFAGDPGQLSLVTTRYLSPDEATSHMDIYLYDGRFCVKREYAGVTCMTSSRVELTSLTFSEITQSNGAESVQMNFTIRYKSPRTEYYYTESVQTSARLRAY